MFILCGELLPIADGVSGVFATAGMTSADLAQRARRARSIDRLLGENSLVIVSSLDDLDRLKPAWQALEKANSGHTVFHGFDWCRRCAQASIETGRRVVVVVVGPLEKPRLILPLAVTRSGPVRVAQWLGDPLAQYGDVLASGDATDADLEAAVSAARAQKIDVFWLKRVRQDASAMRFAFFRGLAESGADIAPFVRLDEGALPCPSKERRRARKKIERLGLIETKVLTGAPARKAAERAVQWKLDWLERRGEASALLFNVNWRNCLLDLAGSSGAHVAELRVARRAVATEIGFVKDGHFASFLGAFDPEFGWASPGKVLTEDILAWAHGQGLAAYDFLPPGDAYKLGWTGAAVAVSDRILAVSLAGRAFGFAAARKNMLKSLLAAAPPSLRRALGRLRHSLPG